MIRTTPGDEWMTPKWVWEPWHKLLGFELDAAATKINAIMPAYLSADQDARRIPWREYVPKGSAVWCNPPYSQAAGPLEVWVRKFWEESKNNGVVVVALLPSDTSTGWFDLIYNRNHNTWQPGCRGTFLPRRIAHIDPETGKSLGTPKFGSIIVLFDRRLQNLY